MNAKFVYIFDFLDISFNIKEITNTINLFCGLFIVCYKKLIWWPVILLLVLCFGFIIFQVVSVEQNYIFKNTFSSIENVALRGVAFQSSLGHPADPASRVIDGRYSTLSTTENKPGQWVTVDLLVPYAVTFIQLAYKKDCCYNENVKVDNTR